MRSIWVAADAAGGALAAGFVDAETEVELGDLDHGVVLVHHDHAAGAHDGAELLQVFVADGVSTGRRGSRRRGPARLNGLDFFTVEDGPPQMS
jgi:hypothetical protein